jgi:hypothetical protein
MNATFHTFLLELFLYALLPLLTWVLIALFVRKIMGRRRWLRRLAEPLGYPPSRGILSPTEETRKTQHSTLLGRDLSPWETCFLIGEVLIPLGVFFTIWFLLHH